MKLVLGGLALFPATGEAEDVAKAAWALDKTTKNFLLACWRRRAHFVGHLRVCGGALVREDATDAREAASVPAETPRRSAAQLEACKPFWVDWIRKPAKPRSGKRSKGRSPFFVVLAGSRPGIFTSWMECKQSVSGFPGAKFNDSRKRSRRGRSGTVDVRPARGASSHALHKSLQWAPNLFMNMRPIWSTSHRIF